MILQLEGDPDEPGRRRRQQQGSDRAVDRAVGDVEEALGVGPFGESFPERTDDLVVEVRVAGQGGREVRVEGVGVVRLVVMTFLSLGSTQESV